MAHETSFDSTRGRRARPQVQGREITTSLGAQQGRYRTLASVVYERCLNDPHFELSDHPIIGKRDEHAEPVARPRFTIRRCDGSLHS